MGRSPCGHKNGLKKGPWTPEEDQMLMTYIQTHGSGNWRNLPKNAGLQRCGKSCRLRWTNYLRPDIKRGRFSFEEEETIVQLHSILGNKWSAIAGRLPGRTDNEIKNYWNTHIRKRLLRNGIDPVTHAPRLDLLDLSSILGNPSFLNMSSLFSNQAILNPDILRLATALLSLKRENQELLLQHLPENQLCNSILLDQVKMPLQSQFQNPVQEIFSSTTPIAQYLSQKKLSQSNMANFSTNTTNIACENPLETHIPSTLNNSLISHPNFVYCCNTTPTVPEITENSGLHSASSSEYQNLGIDSVLSTPSSDPDPLHSTLTFVNTDEETYCSSLLKFEALDSLDIEDFM